MKYRIKENKYFDGSSFMPQNRPFWSLFWIDMVDTPYWNIENAQKKIDYRIAEDKRDESVTTYHHYQ